MLEKPLSSKLAEPIVLKSGIKVGDSGVIQEEESTLLQPTK